MRRSCWYSLKLTGLLQALHLVYPSCSSARWTVLPETPRPGSFADQAQHSLLPSQPLQRILIQGRISLMLRDNGWPERTLVHHSWGAGAHVVIVDHGTPVLLEVSSLDKPRSSKVTTREHLKVSHWNHGLSCVVVVAIGVCVVETPNGLATGAEVNFFCRQDRTWGVITRSTWYLSK